MRPNNAGIAKGPRRVLVVGMLDSVHFARWLWQFRDEEIDFSIFAAKKYRNLNPLLVSLLNSNETAHFKLVSNRVLGLLSGYLDYIKYEVFDRQGASRIRKKSLSRIVSQNTFDFIHALEIQGAGYLLTQFSKSQLAGSKVILTNWGSDIYFFKEQPGHLELIKKSLAMADFYSAECHRDYVLARQLGFSGHELPCIPNAGGFNLNQLSTPLSKASTRLQIMIKGYGGRFGRAEIPISLIPKIDELFPEFTYLIYSATEDIVDLVESLPPALQKKIRLSSVRERISREDFLEEFANSRVYIGCSNSDGISTSFLEALVHGAYPIQTNTSCAEEWVQKGFIATLVNLNSTQLFEAVQEALSNNNLVDLAAVQNSDLSMRHLEYKSLQVQALTFYQSPALG
jgi:hypothetical protein